jgi:hypothetical protein
MSKALNTHLSITDGGPYSLMNVTHFKQNIQTQIKKPGMNILSSYYKYKDYRYFEIKPLGGIPWDTFLDKNLSPYEYPFTNLDELATKHIQTFWAHYNINIDFSIEHKIENTFTKGAYIMKAHYGFKIYDEITKTYSKNIFKIRGYRDDPQIPYKNPIKDLLESILNDKVQEFKIPNNGVFQTKKLLKLKSWTRDCFVKKGLRSEKEDTFIFVKSKV